MNTISVILIFCAAGAFLLFTLSMMVRQFNPAFVFMALTAVFGTIGIAVGEVSQREAERNDVIRVTGDVTALQKEQWKKDKTYLGSQLALQEASPQLGEWFVDRKLSKSQIETNKNSIVYEFGVHERFIRTVMKNGQVILINCKGMGSKCPTVSEANRD